MAAADQTALMALAATLAKLEMRVQESNKLLAQILDALKNGVYSDDQEDVEDAPIVVQPNTSGVPSAGEVNDAIKAQFDALIMANGGVEALVASVVKNGLPGANSGATGGT